jgi:hypothetical protein
VSGQVRGCTCANPYRLGSKHKCTPGRPLCRRTDSKRNRTCNCDAYPYVHREGSGRCFANPNSTERMNELAYGTLEETVPF